ncbi:MAG: hypothetical protein KGI04_04375 [Candidatus Micrarchaeota archaeon]|nr:hypothetical protein [Candidatus Micrarchaeota archaeon]
MKAEKRMPASAFGELLKPSDDNIKLVELFGASRITPKDTFPGIQAFRAGLAYSHRGADEFCSRLLKNERSAIISGFNSRVKLHLGHAAILGMDLEFQRKYGTEVFIPISDDESYLLSKAQNPQESLSSAFKLVRSLLAFGFNPDKTRVLVNQLHSETYSLAIKMSRGLTLSEIKAIYGFGEEQNIGMYFYPTIQAAQLVTPQLFGIRNTLAPIGPNEDVYLRACRDVTSRFGYAKPAVLHFKFMPGIDGRTMSSSKGNAIPLLEEEDALKDRLAASAGGDSVAYLYLKCYFSDSKSATQACSDFMEGKVKSEELRSVLLEHLLHFTKEFRARYDRIGEKEMGKVLLTNENRDLKDVLRGLAYG